MSTKRNLTKYLDNFLFRRSWAELIFYLPDDDTGKLFKAIFEHTRGGSAREYLQDTPQLMPVASAMIRDLEGAAKRYLRNIGALAAILEEERSQQNEYSQGAGEAEQDNQEL